MDAGFVLYCYLSCNGTLLPVKHETVTFTVTSPGATAEVPAGRAAELGGCGVPVWRGDPSRDGANGVHEKESRPWRMPSEADQATNEPVQGPLLHGWI